VNCAAARRLQGLESRGRDAVLSDLAMPEMERLQVFCFFARADAGRDPGRSVIMLPRKVGAHRRRAMKAGAYDYLPKPFDPADIVLAVRRATRRDPAVQNAAAFPHRERVGRAAIVASSPAMRRVLLERLARVGAKGRECS